ncbi:hypothetical protein ACHAW5_001298 [Stephanodiscus triporus]|uniref:ATP-grasp domain-containing protein n=1 Tax=Stephanodiscus triporus TaxID=2934178 RepID=A0ABD3NK52_9STRA
MASVHSVLRWALIALMMLTSATTTYGSMFTFADGRTRPVRLFHGVRVGAGKGKACRTILPTAKTRTSTHSTAALYIRGGATEHDRDNRGDHAMQELRKEWSKVGPATPSISWPVPATDMALGHDSTYSTLGDVGNEINHEANPSDQPMKAIIIMDGFSPYHGQYLSHAARHIYGAAVIHVLSDFITRYLYQVQEQTDHLSSRLPDLERGSDVEDWFSLLPSSMEICGIYCESDSGLEDAERLGLALGLYPHCHDGMNPARRDKFLMNQVLSEEGGLDVVKQKSCRTLEQAEAFARELGLSEDDNRQNSSPLVVVKPLRGVASDDVHLCSNFSTLREAFTKILHSPVFGSPTAAKHEKVLVQEFATGIEYAVDVVCRDGERKVAALWRYDKRAVNGAPFVYFATELISADQEGLEKEVCDYVFKALEALGVRWGLSHVEVIAETSPVTGKTRVRLVEVNCRQHNTDFSPLTNACIGYNALDLYLSAHLDADNIIRHSQALHWDNIPALPSTHACAAIIHFVSHVEGSISRIRFDILEEIHDLPSVMDVHVYPQFMEVGNPIQKTIDIRTDTGWAHLMNNDEEEFRRDYARLVELMKDMFETS